MVSSAGNCAAFPESWTVRSTNGMPVANSSLYTAESVAVSSAGTISAIASLNSAPSEPGSTIVAPAFARSRSASFGDADRVLVGLGVDLHEFAHHADADAGERRVVGKGIVGPRGMFEALGGRGIARIVAREHGEHGCRVLDRAAQHARAVARERGRHDAGAADEAVGRDDADEAAVRGGIARRGSGLLAERAHHEIGGDGRARAAARAAGAAGRVVGIAGGAAIGAAVARSVFAEIGLGEDDGARGAQARDDGRILRRAVVGVARGSAAGRAHVGGVELILDRERDAVQRALELSGLPRIRHRAAPRLRARRAWRGCCRSCPSPTACRED